jgi:outer membrane lipoprotein carrier protein
MGARTVIAAGLMGVLIAGFGPVGRAADLNPADFAQKLQRHYEAVKDFSADFAHTYRGGVLRKLTTERGRVEIKKPGKMRWDYLTPDKKQFISDGTRIYSYIPDDKQVIVSSMPRDDQATPTLFLAGKGSFTRDFTPSFIELPADLPAKTVALKLVPKTAQRDYDWIVLAVDPDRLEIRGLLTVDPQGGTSTLAFTNLKENIGLSDNEFVFKMPRGVDVVTDSSRP